MRILSKILGVRPGVDPSGIGSQVRVSAFLPGSQSAVRTVPSDLWDAAPGLPPAPLQAPKGMRPPVPWGQDNRQPERLNALALGNPLLAAAMEFRSALLYGDGVVPATRRWHGGRWLWEPCYQWPEVNQFLEQSDINAYFMECALDLTVLNNAFAELSLSADRQRVESIRHREATFSRWEEANPSTGEIEHHYFANHWGQPGGVASPLVTPALPRRGALGALRRAAAGRKGPSRYIMGVWIPTLGRPYYAEPWWTSVARSGWLDFAAAIPEYKAALLRKGMQIRYVVQVRGDFWDRYYQQRGATTLQQKRQAQEEWLRELDAFLKDNRNSGKSFVVESSLVGDRFEEMVKIVPLRNETQGGELLADLEEASNILAYGMGVHPSLIGASPGKNKSINGTEARELFIIKQALLKPLRDRMLAPLYLAKAFNGWPEEVHFAVQNLELTTLDRGTGAIRTIGQPTLQ